VRAQDAGSQRGPCVTVRLHPTAIIDPAAELDSTVEVGPYSVIGARVKINAGTRVGSHVVLDGPMQIGRDNQIFPYAALGAISQDKTAKPEDPTSVVIGDGNVIREFVTIQRGTMKEFDTKRGVTAVGDRNWIMNYCHIAHDCRIGSDTIFANNSSLAGHVEIGDWVVLGGYTLVDAIATVRIGRGEVSAGLENIFDRRYVTYYSQTLTGANADNFNYFAGRGRMFSLRYRVSF